MFDFLLTTYVHERNALKEITGPKIIIKVKILFNRR